jgi:hypothetical protein
MDTYFVVADLQWDTTTFVGLYTLVEDASRESTVWHAFFW